MLNEEKINKIEEQIMEQKRTVDFDTREFTIEFLVNKYLTNIDKDSNDIFVPEYQREFVWDDARQSKLIESITLGLPIPIIFVAEDRDGRLEIVDGSQRIRTLAAFISNDLELSSLDKLTEMNKLKYKDLPASRQRKINNTPIRMIVLSETTTEEVKNDLFERINRGSDILRNMEKRKGIYRGPFTEYVYGTCAKNTRLIKLTPLAKSVEKRQEIEELIIRFFALLDQYPKFKTHKRGIGSVLDEYMEYMNTSFNEKIQEEKNIQLDIMLNYVENSFENGFSKRKGMGVSRVFFEALSVGVYLALKEEPDIQPRRINVAEWFKDEKFNQLVSGKYKTHTPDKILQRIEYVRDKILEKR